MKHLLDLARGSAFAACIVLGTVHAEQVDLPGVKLWFTDTGGNGTPVVLLHANSGTSASWQPQIDALAQGGYRVIAFDRRGWGRSLPERATGPQPMSAAEDLDGLVRHLKLDRFHLVGIAGGGFTVLDYAAWRPERLLGIVVAASTGRFSEPELDALAKRIEIPGLAEANKSSRVFIEVGVSFRAADPEGTQRFIDLDRAARQPGAPAQPTRTPNTFAKIEQIKVPALVMSGGADLLAPPALVEVWARHLPNAELVNVPDAGHSIAWEQPEVFNSLMLHFLAQHSRRGP